MSFPYPPPHRRIVDDSGAGLALQYLSDRKSRKNRQRYHKHDYKINKNRKLSIIPCINYALTFYGILAPILKLLRTTISPLTRSAVTYLIIIHSLNQHGLHHLDLLQDRLLARSALGSTHLNRALKVEALTDIWVKTMVNRLQLLV